MSGSSDRMSRLRASHRRQRTVNFACQRWSREIRVLARELHYVSGTDAKTVGAVQKTKRPGDPGGVSGYSASAIVTVPVVVVVVIVVAVVVVVARLALAEAAAFEVQATVHF